MENFTEADFVLNDLIYSVANKVEVYRVRVRNEILVVKKLYLKSEEDANSNQKEVFAMCTLNHPSIVKVRAGLLGKNFKYMLMVMDYYPDGDLQKEIQRRATYRTYWPEAELNQIFSSLISGHSYMQEQHQLVHRDIKPQNILRKGSQYFIADLGCAFKSRKGESDSLAGTPAYLSPLLSQAYQNYYDGIDISNFSHNAYKSDVFSLGLTFYYMATLVPFDQQRVQMNDQQFIQLVSNNIQRLNYSDNLKRLILWMLAFDERERPDFVQLSGKTTQGNVADKNVSSVLKNNPNMAPYNNQGLSKLQPSNFNQTPEERKQQLMSDYKGYLYSNPQKLTNIKYAKNYKYKVYFKKNLCSVCGINKGDTELIQWGSIFVHQGCFIPGITCKDEGANLGYYLQLRDKPEMLVHQRVKGFCVKCNNFSYFKPSLQTILCFNCIKNIRIDYSAGLRDAFYPGIAKECNEISNYVLCDIGCGSLAEIGMNKHSFCFNCFESYSLPNFNYINEQYPMLPCPYGCCYISFKDIIERISSEVEKQNLKRALEQAQETNFIQQSNNSRTYANKQSIESFSGNSLSNHSSHYPVSNIPDLPSKFQNSGSSIPNLPFQNSGSSIPNLSFMSQNNQELNPSTYKNLEESKQKQKNKVFKADKNESRKEQIVKKVESVTNIKLPLKVKA